MNAAGSTSGSSVHCGPPRSSRIVGGTLCKDRRADRVTRGQVMMFVLGACWAWNPPEVCFGA